MFVFPGRRGFLQEGPCYLFLDTMLPFILKSNRYSRAHTDWCVLSPHLHSRGGEAIQESGVPAPSTLATRWVQGQRLTSVSFHNMVGFPLCALIYKVHRRGGWGASCSLLFSHYSWVQVTLWLLPGHRKLWGSLLVSPGQHDS